MAHNIVVFFACRKPLKHTSTKVAVVNQQVILHRQHPQIRHMNYSVFTSNAKCAQSNTLLGIYIRRFFGMCLFSSSLMYNITFYCAGNVVLSLNICMFESP